MKRKLLIWAGVLAVVTAAAVVVMPPAGAQAGPRLAEDAYRAIVYDDGLKVLALEPESDAEGFRGYRVARSAPVENGKDRARLGVSLWNAVEAAGPGAVAREEFRPRHGLSGVVDGERHDFVICFETKAMRYYAPGGGEEVLGLGAGADAADLDAMLGRAN